MEYDTPEPEFWNLNNHVNRFMDTSVKITKPIKFSVIYKLMIAKHILITSIITIISIYSCWLYNRKLYNVHD